MKNETLKTLGAIFILAACLGAVSPTASRAASVGPGGYTNDFSTQPAAADWATASVAGLTSDITNAAGMDTAVATLTAAGITTQVVSNANNPPAGLATATWSSSGQYLQTRPSGNKFCILMAMLVNNTGSDTNAVTINYDFTAVQPTTEQIAGQQVYYSLTGTASNWVNIPALSSPAAGRVTAPVGLSSTWSNGATLFLLWADDNGTGGPDTANQIDNFFISAGASPLSASISAPTNGQTFVQGATVTVAATGNGPITNLSLYVDGALLVSGPAVPLATNLPTCGLAAGAHTMYASASGGEGVAYSETNIFTITPNLPPAITLSNAGPASVPVGSPITLSATATDDLGVASVDFYLDGVKVFSATNAPWTWTTNGLPPGAHVSYAVAKDRCGLSTTSAIVTSIVQGMVLYSDDFSSQPPAGRWSYLSVAGGGGDIITAAALDTAVAALTAAEIANQVVADTNSPPAGNSSALWSPSGGYLQTRPAGTKFIALMATLTNNTGVDLQSFAVGYTFTQAGILNEEINGHRVYFSLTGVANSWTNLPSLSSTASGPLVTNINVTWRSNSIVYLLWADDNGSPGQDTANQIDNFFVSATTPPTIISLTPANAQACPGGAVNFMVNATGIPPLRYQWRKLSADKTNDIANATNATFAIASAGTNDEGGYVVVVSNYAGGITSFVATLTIAANPVVLLNQPQDHSILGGTSVSFRIDIAVESSLPLSCQWYVNSLSNNSSGILISGATSPQFTIPNASATDAGFYYAVLSNCVGSVTSSVAALAVTYLPLSITAQPQGTTQSVGASWTLTVGVSGTVERLQWFKGSQALAGATNASLTLTNLQRTDTGLYHAEVTNPAPSFAASASAMVVVLVQPYALVPLTNTWKYNQTGTDLGTAWQVVGYDDSSWPAGRGVLAYETDGVVPTLTNTVLCCTAWANSSGRTNITYYFRTTFNLTEDPAQITMTTSNLIDDGCVVYLNGNEVYRINMPTGLISYGTFASGASTEGEFVADSLPSSLLVQGTNVLAVEVHQVALTSSDITFGFVAIVNPSLIQITNQPQSAAVDELRPVSFTVGCRGGVPQYQWYKRTLDGAAALAGANSATLTLIHPLLGTDDGAYFVVVSNSFNLETSADAMLTITQAAPSILSQPVSQFGCLSEAAQFQVTASGSQLNFFQWRFNDINIPGATNTAILIPDVGSNDVGAYSVIVSNGLGTATSSNATLRLSSSFPVFTLQALSRIGTLGGSTVFTSAAEGCHPLSSRWQFNNVDIPGANSLQLVLTNLQASNDGFYRIIVSNNFGAVTSSEAQLVLTIGSALNYPGWNWTLASAPWFMQTTVTHDGLAALQSGNPSAGSVLRTTATGPGKLSFWWKIQTDGLSGRLDFSMDSQLQVRMTESVDWEKRSLFVPPGMHTIEWKTLNGTMITWLDQMDFDTNVAPRILSFPTATNVPAGARLALLAGLDGYPPLHCQWQFNGHALVGSTNATLELSNVQAACAGTYSLVVANDYGSTETNMVLSVNDSAPIFLPQRMQMRVLPGQTATLVPHVLGSDPRAYQWRFNDVDIPGATNGFLLLQAMSTREAGFYSVQVSNAIGIATGPNIELVVGWFSNVVHISADGLSAKYLTRGLQTEPARYPNFQRLLAEGASTLNARCDYDISYTVPNHLSMLTGRPALQPAGQSNTVHHGYTYDDTFGTNMTVHNTGNTNVSYKASVFDVAHDRGLRTGFLVGKTSLAVCSQSYNAINGAPDLIPPDNGPSKIDVVFMADTYSSNVVSAFLPSLTNGAPCQYAFLHLTDLDNIGHSAGWGPATWFAALETLDTQVGRLLSAIETNSNPAIALETAVILTADHGGYGPTHVDPTLEFDYTIPLFVWAPGFETGTDLYGFFANRADPGTNRVDYNAIWQPLRNGDTGNLALSLLGLPSIPGSTLIPMFPATTASLTLSGAGSTLSVVWPASIAGFTLEASDSLAPGAAWSPVLTGVVTNANGFQYPVPSSAGPQFFRLKKD